MIASTVVTSLNVSRETLAKLIVLEDFVHRWSTSINLVARPSLPDLWTRHIEDSVFISRTVPGTSDWLDIGSGAGFPGLVVAIMYNGRRKVTLVESDRRKAEFLRAVRRDLEIDLEILNERIESVPFRDVGVISARALAPLPKLLNLCLRHASPSTNLVLPKGRNWHEEVLASRKDWQYDLDVIDNTTSKDGVVLKISNLIRVPHEA